jgi:uncharacterized Zn-finger protein
MKDKLFQCGVCDLNCKTKETLKMHMLTHSQKPFTCGICCKQYTQKQALQMHIAQHGEGDKCMYCDEVIHNR